MGLRSFGPQNGTAPQDDNALGIALVERRYFVYIMSNEFPDALRWRYQRPSQKSLSTQIEAHAWLHAKNTISTSLSISRNSATFRAAHRPRKNK